MRFLVLEMQTRLTCYLETIYTPCSQLKEIKEALLLLEQNSRCLIYFADKS